MGARGDDEVGEVGRSLPAQGLERFADLERVADRAPKRLVHVGQQRGRLALEPARQL